MTTIDGRLMADSPHARLGGTAGFTAALFAHPQRGPRPSTVRERKGALVPPVCEREIVSEWTCAGVSCVCARVRTHTCLSLRAQAHMCAFAPGVDTYFGGASSVATHLLQLQLICLQPPFSCPPDSPLSCKSRMNAATCNKHLSNACHLSTVPRRRPRISALTRKP